MSSVLVIPLLPLVFLGAVLICHPFILILLFFLHLSVFSRFYFFSLCYKEYLIMSIFLPGAAEDQALALDEMTPREIVAELDKYVVGQQAAKRAVAIALRNRMRRQKLSPELADEIMPKNIIMIGPTGVGKTEIARRLAKLTNSPFLKVEASKFTEVGYVGRDV